MRWFLIDRFTEFVAAKYATAVKSVSLSDEAVDEYAAGRPCYPSTLIIEGMAQTGGLLVCQISDFKDRVVLAKVQSCKFHFEAYPGEVIHFRAELQTVDNNGAFIQGTTHINEKLHGEISLMFAILNDDRFGRIELFEPAELCRTCRLLRLFEIGVHEDGTPVKVPEHMLEAERAVLLRGYD